MLILGLEIFDFPHKTQSGLAPATAFSDAVIGSLRQRPFNLPGKITAGCLRHGGHGNEVFLIPANFENVDITFSPTSTPIFTLSPRYPFQPPNFYTPVCLESSFSVRLTMSIWDSISGRKSPKGSEGLEVAAPDASAFLSETSLPDPTQLHPLAGLNQDTLDYLTLEDSALDELPGSRSVLPSRGWSDDLCYGTGTTYLSALTMGGAWGLAEGMKRTPVTAPPKIRLNAVLNSITRRGPFLGNSAGVVAMVYNGVNSTIGYARGKHDSANSVAAGALSGMLFKSTRGVKPMVISGGIVAGIAGAWAVSSSNLE